MSHTQASRDFRVFKLRFYLAEQDPDMPGTRYHTAIFVETNDDGSGFLHHVIGDIAEGMAYQKRTCPKPETSWSFRGKSFLGYADATTYPEQWDILLGRVPAPERQKALNEKTKSIEPVKTWDPLTFYEPGEVRTPLIKCTEWTEQRAVPALENAGLLTL